MRISPQFVLPLLGLLVAGCDPPARSRPTVASVEVVRPAVEVSAPGGRPAVAARARLGAGDGVRVLERAQAVLRHDGGARLLLDGGADLTLSDAGATMNKGRLWADAPAGANLQVLGAGYLLSAGGGGAGFEIAAGDGAAV